MSELTADKVRELLDYDPLTGVLTWRHIEPPRRWHGKSAGAIRRTGYVRISIDAIHYQAHRVVWLWVHGSWPTDQIDHINRVKHDNRIENLRDASPKENSANRPQRRPSSEWKRKPRKPHKPRNPGQTRTTEPVLRAYVSWHKGRERWVGRGLWGRRDVHLGYFKTKEEALANLPAAIERVSARIEQQQKDGEQQTQNGIGKIMQGQPHGQDRTKTTYGRISP